MKIFEYTLGMNINREICSFQIAKAIYAPPIYSGIFVYTAIEHTSVLVIFAILVAHDTFSSSRILLGGVYF